MFSVLTSYLDNGLRVIIRKIKGQRTVSCGVWINQGVKDEKPEKNGISHLVEHLMTKLGYMSNQQNTVDNFSLLNEIMVQNLMQQQRRILLLII